MTHAQNVRLIARLDIKGPNLIKGIHLEGLRIVGNPQIFASRYYEDRIDELLYMDTVASLYGRNNLLKIIEDTTRNVFIPITVGGGIRSLEDATQVLRAGADKVAVNTAAIQNPELIREIAQRFGSQCMVLSIEAKEQSPGKWEAFTNNGRERTHRDVVDWAKEGVALGAGEILLTSVDKEGTQKGFDLALIKSISTVVPVPVIASGGMGNSHHLTEAVMEGGADAVAVAHCIHYSKVTIVQMKQSMKQNGIQVRL